MWPRRTSARGRVLEPMPEPPAVEDDFSERRYVDELVKREEELELSWVIVRQGNES